MKMVFLFSIIFSMGSCGTESRRGSCMVTYSIQCVRDENTIITVLFDGVKVADNKPLDECPGEVERYSPDLTGEYEVNCVVDGLEPSATIIDSNGSDEINCASNGFSIDYILGDEISTYVTNENQSEEIQCIKYKGHYEL